MSLKNRDGAKRVAEKTGGEELPKDARTTFLLRFTEEQRLAIEDACDEARCRSMNEFIMRSLQAAVEKYGGEMNLIQYERRRRRRARESNI